MSNRPHRLVTDTVVWHCSATPPDRGIGAADIDSMHKARGWQGIGYHFVIRRNGAVELGEHLQNQGAHVKGHNQHTVGVCLVGGVDSDGDSENNFTQAQWDSADMVRDFLDLIYPGVDHIGHRDLSPDQDGNGQIERWEFVKDCPCFDVKSEFGVVATPKAKKKKKSKKKKVATVTKPAPKQSDDDAPDFGGFLDTADDKADE